MPDLHVLVTGGAGFIGAEVAVAALRAGCHVTVLDSLPRTPIGKVDRRAVTRLLTAAAEPIEPGESAELLRPGT